MADLSVNIAGLKLKNPVIAASGTFGFGGEFSQFYDINKLGGISVKGLTLKPRQGNAPIRIAETPAGILNSVGLQNPGVEEFISVQIPWLKRFDVPVIANIAGHSFEEYFEMAEILNDVERVDALEINVSCPNVKEGCVAFGVSPEAVEQITAGVKKRFNRTVITKLTPNITDITSTARAAEAGGADAVSLINTLLGMVIDINKKKPLLANNTGGLSGPAVKPIAVRMVHEVYNSVKIPVIGMGGISCGSDAVEFMIAGASAVMVGTANLVDPYACPKIIYDIEEYLDNNNYKSLDDIVGKLTLN